MSPSVYGPGPQVQQGDTSQLGTESAKPGVGSGAPVLAAAWGKKRAGATGGSGWIPVLEGGQPWTPHQKRRLLSCFAGIFPLGTRTACFPHLLSLLSDTYSAWVGEGQKQREGGYQLQAGSPAA